MLLMPHAADAVAAPAADNTAASAGIACWNSSPLRLHADMRGTCFVSLVADVYEH